MKERLLVLDGHSLMFRAFYALPMLTNSEGLHTNAIYGFSSMLLKMKEEIKPDYIVATFDRKAPTFRHESYKDYKAGRKKMPPELSEQFPVIKDMLNLLAINIFEIDGFEADDIIGTLSVFAEKKDIEVYIVTGDRDALQLCTDNVKVVINKKGMSEKEIYDKRRMMEEYGITPKQFIDVKGLMGDASDNILGVPGIGEKTAYKLIKEYGSIEGVLSNIDNISGKKVKDNLIQYSEQAIFSKKLATIITEVPIEIDLEDIKSKENINVVGLRQLFYKLQFKSLLEKMPEVNLNDNEQAELIELKDEEPITDISNINALENALKNLRDEVYIKFTIKDKELFTKCNIVKMYLSDGLNNYVVNYEKIFEEDEKKAVIVLKEFFEDGSIEKVCHDIKMPLTILQKIGIMPKGIIFDTKIAAYILDPAKGEYELKDIINGFLGVDVTEDSEVALMQKLYLLLKKKIEENKMENLFYQVEMPLVQVLASMEYVGFKVDLPSLDALGIKFKSEIDRVQWEIYTISEENFNINSPKQLGKILFEKLDLPVIKKTKTGYSTNAEVLEELKDKHPIIEKILYYRQLTKLFSTYVEGLKIVIDKDGRIHTSFNQTVTTTGRLSSTEPNLQNIPVKSEMGKEIRKVFMPLNENSVILSADYSQIELRVLAHIAGDENMIQAFISGKDIHTKTASDVFKVPLEEVTPQMRSSAKAVNFGIVYGIGDFSLAKDIKVSRKEAKAYIEAYFDRYPMVKKYMEEIVKKAEAEGYVTTIMGRRRYIPEINGSNKIVKAFGERLAMNTPIQGSAADIIKLAMVNVFKKLKEKNLKSTLLLQVHDELILNVEKEELDIVKEIVKDGMENVLKLSVPLEVDINYGNTWYDAK